MKTSFHAALVALALAPLARPTGTVAAEIPLHGHLFQVPDGFTIERVASSDLIPRPVSGSFDPQGRLYVTDSSGLNIPPSEQLKDPRSRVLRLVDTDGDGTFDKADVFADKVMFPQGCLWHDGSVYVAGPPSIWKFTDTDGDGVADRREEWYKGEILTGCANDVHGPYLGPEGMLYWTKGAFGRLALQDHRGTPINDRCAHVFRAWPDRRGFESVSSGGMDNPVEIAFTAEGEPILISTFLDLSQPGRRDGLSHSVYGGVFGKANDVLEERGVRRTGDLLPAMTHYGPAAACALMRYQGEGLGPEYRNNLFATLFNLRKVTRHIVRPRGATYVTEDSDFVVSDQMDFHPTDVLEDADGSLLIIDTGGWYKLCCPSSQLAKADVLGGIYRVRRENALPRPRTPATTSTARTHQHLVEPPTLIETSTQVQLKRLAIEANPSQAGRLRDALRQHAGQASASDVSAHIVRVAAEGLGRMRDRDSVPLLLDAIAANPAADRFLEHSLLYALIEIGAPETLQPFLKAADPRVRRAALLCLEQIPGVTLTASEVATWLASPDTTHQETARWIIRRHPEWSGELTRLIRDRLAHFASAPDDRRLWENLLGLLARSPEGQALLTEVSTQSRYSQSTRIAALDAIANSGLKELPAGWLEAIRGILATSPSAAAVRAVRSLPLPREGDPQLNQALHQLARDTRQPTALRLDALAALPAGAMIDKEEFALLKTAIEPARPPGERLAAATTLGRLKAAPEQLDALVEVLRVAGPLELPRVLPAFASAGSDALGKQLLAALKESKALRSLRPEDLKPHLGAFPVEIRNAADTLLLEMRSTAAEDLAGLDSLARELEQIEGRVRQGQAIFNGTKAACSSCHRLGYLGGDVGPDLTAIGTIRSERDLLEAVIHPSASFVRSYEPWIATDTEGEEYSGVLRRDTADEIVLATGPGAEVRIPRTRLADLRQGNLSTMPAGLDAQLTRQELADLIAFLKNTKWGVN